MINTYEPTPELEGLEVHGITRGSFILRSALAAGAVYGLGAVARSSAPPWPPRTPPTWTSSTSR